MVADIVDLAAGDPAKGAGYGVGSPLAIALAWRGTARWWLGRPGWRQDLHDAVAMARRSNPETFSGVVAWTYGFAMQYGVLRADDSVVRACEDAVQTAQSASSDRAVGLAAYTLAVGLLNQDAAADRHRGLELMMQARDIWLRKRAHFLIPVTDVWAARETARRGDRDAAIPEMRQAVDELRQAETSSMACGVPAFWWRHCWSVAPRATWPKPKRRSTGWRTCAADHDSAMLEITLLRLRALLARARGDDVAYRDLLGRYRAMAESLGFEGHIAWAEAMSKCRKSPLPTGLSE